MIERAKDFLAIIIFASAIAGIVYAMVSTTSGVIALGSFAAASLIVWACVRVSDLWMW